MTKTNDRLLLIDWLKILILAAIQTFHANEFIFFEDDFPLIRNSLLYMPAYYYARLFSLGGQGLVSIIYLLFGFSGKSRSSLLKISGFALIGQLILTFAFFEGNYLDQIEWDIYLYIAATNLLLLWLPRASWPLVILSLVMLFIPPSFWKDIVPDNLVGNVLIGRIENSPSGAWPMLPWFFLALLFFNLGSLIRGGKLDLHQWYRTETFLWPILLGLSLPFLGHYYWTPIGPRFYEFNFHQSSHLFWPNFLPYILVMRLAFLDSVKEKLSRHKLSRFVSRLMWTRQLGAAYVISVLYLGLGARFEETYRENVYAYDLFFLSIMPVTEIIVRVLVYLKQKLSGPRGGSSAR
jgi:hypothetical protein